MDAYCDVPKFYQTANVRFFLDSYCLCANVLHLAHSENMGSRLQQQVRGLEYGA